MLGVGPDGRIVGSADTVAPEAADLVRSLESGTSSRSVPAQVWWAWRRIQECCTASGIGLEAIAKTVVYLRSEEDLVAYEAIRSLFTARGLPAFDCVFVPDPGPVEEAAVQIDLTALNCA